MASVTQYIIYCEHYYLQQEEYESCKHDPSHF